MENESIGYRISLLIKDLKISQKDFAATIKADPTHINKIIKNKSNPSDSLMYLICERHRVNFDWLKQGIGSMYSSKPSTNYNEALNLFNALDEDLQEFALAQLNQLLILQQNKSKESV